MKKYVLTLCTLSLCAFSFGQERKLGISLQLNSPSKDDINVGWFNIDGESLDGYNLKHTSYSTGLLANYNINSETTLRFRFGMTEISIKEYEDKYYNRIHVVESATGQQTKLHFAPGIVWRMNKKNFNLFSGFEIPINLHGPFSMRYVYSWSDSLSGRIEDNGDQTTTLPKGYSFGVGAIMGFNFFLTKCVSLGAKFAPSMLYAKLSGKTKTITTQTSPLYSQDEDKGFTFYDQRFSISLSVWFKQQNNSN